MKCEGVFEAMAEETRPSGESPIAQNANDTEPDRVNCTIHDGAVDPARGQVIRQRLGRKASYFDAERAGTFFAKREYEDTFFPRSFLPPADAPYPFLTEEFSLAKLENDNFMRAAEPLFDAPVHSANNSRGLSLRDC